MHLLTLFWERPHLLLIQMRQTCIDRNECILLACYVGIIWPFAHMRIVFAQRLTRLADSVGRAKRRSLISFRSVRSWLWEELMLELAIQEICGVRRQWPWDSSGPWALPWTRLEEVRGIPHLGTRESVLGRIRWLLQQSRRVPEGLHSNNNNNNLHRKTADNHERTYVLIYLIVTLI